MPLIVLLTQFHCFGNNFFTDHYEWLDSLGRISNEVDYDWYIKCHPNSTVAFDNTIDLTKNLHVNIVKLNI